MSLMHFFYQTRWAVRNDPALGVMMVMAFVTFITWRNMIRDAFGMIRRDALTLCIYASQMEERK